MKDDFRAPPRSCLTHLAELAEAADSEAVWPAKSWRLVEESGALRWSVPQAYGGENVSTEALLQGYESLASACLTSCFILSQRDAACRRIVACDNERIRHELLPPLVEGRHFATVGLSQLTTSRQHGKPVFIAHEEKDCFVFEGMIPWVTGAGQAQHLVIGASLEDGRQVLMVLPVDTPGVRVDPPMPLMALQGSMTAVVHCEKVRVGKEWLLAGPEEKVMQGRKGGAGGLQTSCLALGLAQSAVNYLQDECKKRDALQSGTERLDNNLQKLREEMYRIARANGPSEAITNLRAQANHLVLQATQAALIASKGTGFTHPHPAQRWVRQAMFFLVWSCPWPAASATLDYITFRPEQECV